MIILNRDGSFEWQSAAGHTNAPTAGAIELPADLVAQQSDLFDRVFAFAFDVLGLIRIELRIRRGEPEPAE